MEVFGVCLIVFIGLGVTPSISALLIMHSVLLLPIISLTIQARREQHISTGKKIALCVSSVLAIIGVVLLGVGAKISQENKPSVVIGIILLSISWMPCLQKKTMGNLDVRATIVGVIDLLISWKSCCKKQTGSAYQNMEQGTEAHRSEGDVEAEKNSHWRSLFISSLVKVVLTIPISITTFYFISEREAFLDALQEYKLGWYSRNWNIFERHSQHFITNILTTIFGYMIGVFACRTRIDRGSFTLPLWPAAPMVATAILMIKEVCTLGIFMGLDGEGVRCQVQGGESRAFAWTAAICFIVSQSVMMWVLSFKGSSIILEYETKVR